MLNYKEFKLLQESKKDIKKVKNFANVPEIYEWAEERDESLIIFISNVIVKKLKEHFLKDIDYLNIFLTGENTGDEEFETSVKNYIKYIQNSIQVKLNTIINYVNSPLHSKKPNINKLNFEEAYKLAEEFHDNIETDPNYIIGEEDGEIIKIYDDGYYWIDLESTKSEDEAKAMGHCGTTNEGTTILSLRKNKKPHVTVAYDETEDIFTQIKGKENNKPISKYHKYIVDLIIFLNVKGFKSEYERNSDFLPEDLDEELYEKLKKEAPEYIENSKELPIEELRTMYYDDIKNNFKEEAYLFPYDFWYCFDDDGFIESIIEDKANNLIISDTSPTEDELLKYISDNIDLVDEKVKKYLKDKLDYLYDLELEDMTIDDLNEDDKEEYLNKLDNLNNDTLEYIEYELDENEKIEFIEEFSSTYDYVYNYYENIYDNTTVEDYYKEMYGNTEDLYKLDIFKHYNTMNYFDEDCFARRISDDVDEEYLRSRYNL